MTRVDFSIDLFSNGTFIFFNSEGEGCAIVFPICMYSFVKFYPAYLCDASDPQCINCAFCETVTVTLVKNVNYLIYLFLF